MMGGNMEITRVTVGNTPNMGATETELANYCNQASPQEERMRYGSLYICYE